MSQAGKAARQGCLRYVGVCRYRHGIASQAALDYAGIVPKIKVLFLCTGNSCRSQMAEGWARHPGKTKVVHVGFEDPPKLTEGLPDDEPKLAVYRRVRDEIRRFVERLPEGLAER